MKVISDVHAAVDATRRLVASGETILILGDLVNLVDYRSGDGAVAEVLGVEFALDAGRARARADYPEMRRLWAEATADRRDEVRGLIGASLARQYEAMREALVGGRGMVIHGNVDRPRLLRESLPEGFEYVHGQKRTIRGLVFGFVGGGMATPMQVEGEMSDEDMEAVLDDLGPVDVLCSHVPPAVGPLRTDVITGKAERGSEPILRYLVLHQPRLHLFGDVHQPQASRWRVGRTLCRNVGYFRATGRPFDLDIDRIA